MKPKNMTSKQQLIFNIAMAIIIIISVFQPAIGVSIALVLGIIALFIKFF